MNLEDYLFKEVRVTLNCGHVFTATVGRSSSRVFPYLFTSVVVVSEAKGPLDLEIGRLILTYTKEGVYDDIYKLAHPYSIKTITMSEPKYKHLEDKVKELQAEIDRLKKEEKYQNLPLEFDRNAVLSFLEMYKNGGVTGAELSVKIHSSFIWQSTPQGGEYWSNIYHSFLRNKYGIIKDGEIPKEAILQLQSWVIQSYKEQYGS